MFDMFAAEDHGFSEEAPPPNGDEWDKKMKLAFEKEMLGIYVSDHPLREIAQQVRDASDYSIGAVETLKDGTVGWFAGILTAVVLRPTKKGPMMATVTIEDMDGSIEAVFFPATLEKFRDLIKVDAVVCLKAKLEDSDRGKKLMVLELKPFDGEAFCKPPGVLRIRTDSGVLVNGRKDKLVRILEHYPGRDVVELLVTDPSGTTLVAHMPQTVNREVPGLHAELIELFGGDSIVEG